MIQAMIAAANADGIIDARERAAILNRLRSAELSGEEHQFIAHELLDPKPMGHIVAAASSPELARRVYLASLLAIEADTEKEIEYLRDLVQQLGLSRQTVEAIHEQAGIPLIGEK